MIIGISNNKSVGLVCSCGNKHSFKESNSMWNNEIIKCSCGEKYLPYMNGTVYPIIFKNHEWIKFEGQVATIE